MQNILEFAWLASLKELFAERCQMQIDKGTLNDPLNIRSPLEPVAGLSI